MESMSKKIKLALVERDINQTDLCKKIKYDKGNFSRRIDNNNFGTELLERIADGLGCNLQIEFIDKMTGKKL